MTAQQVIPPYESFKDTSGKALDGGYIYVGTKDLNPITNPVNVYWDEALTISAAQPIRTVGGYPSYNGSPGKIHVQNAYSVAVYDKNNNFIYSDLDNDNVISNSLGWIDPLDYGDGTANATNINLALADISSTNATLIIRPQEWTIDTSITFPSNVSVWWVGGANFSVSTGVTVAFNGPCEFPLRKLFTLAGTGVVTFGTGYLDHVYPQWWGAIGDGSTENLTAFQLATAAYSKIMITKGTYKITGEIQFPSNTTIVGENRDSCVLNHFQISTNQYLFDVVTKSNCHFKSFTIDSNQDQNNDTGIYMIDTNYSSVEDVYFKNGSFGVYLTNSSTTASPDYTVNLGNSVINCIAKDLVETGYTFTKASSTIVTSNKAYNCGADGFKTNGISKRLILTDNYAEGSTRDGFDLFDGFIESICSDNTAYNNTLNGFEWKGTFDATYGDYVARDSVFSNNQAISNGSAGFGIQSVRDVAIIGNMATSNTGSGFSFNDIQNCNVTGCVSSKNSQHGFVFLTGSSTSRSTISSCSAFDNSWDDGVTQNGHFNGFHLESNNNSSLVFLGCQALNGTVANQKGGQKYGLSFGQTAATGGITGTYVEGESLSFVGSGATGVFHRASGSSVIYTLVSGTPAVSDVITGASATSTISSISKASNNIISSCNFANNITGGIAGVKSDNKISTYLNGLSNLAQLGHHTAIGAETLSGYITIYDADGTARKVGIIS